MIYYYERAAPNGYNFYGDRNKLGCNCAQTKHRDINCITRRDATPGQENFSFVWLFRKNLMNMGIFDPFIWSKENK